MLMAISFRDPSETIDCGWTRLRSDRPARNGDRFETLFRTSPGFWEARRPGARFTVVHRDTFAGSSWPAEVKGCLACGFAYACPAKMPGEGGFERYSRSVLIGYARVSTSGQDLAAQRDGLAALGVDDQHVHVDHGLSGTTRARPGLREALAACRAGDVLVVTKLDRLARSLRDATDIADELTKKGVALNLGGAVYDPTDPVGRLLFNVLGMVAEFEADLIRARTREGMAIAKAAGKLRGRKPKLTASQEKHLVQLHRTGAHTTSEIAELFGVARSTVYRAVQRVGQP